MLVDMKSRRVLIVGDSLFAETLTRMLREANADAIEVIGSAPTPAAALPLLKTHPADAVIVAGIGQTPVETLSQFMSEQPDLAIISADLNTHDVQVITHRRVAARRDDLIKVILRLPARRGRSRRVA
jgi:DNA-binding NarL/FixJ family response regulator